MKRAMRAKALTQVDDYFGEFHTLITQLKNRRLYANCRNLN
jgi:hypothetical protein